MGKDLTKFVEVTTQACKDKASAWAARSQCRTTELQALMEAVEILKQDGAGETFLQVHSYLDSVTSRYRDQLKALVGDDKHFGREAIQKVLTRIDELVKELDQEEKDDIAERDACQSQSSKNKNDLEDLDSEKKSLEEEHDNLVD